MNEHDPKPDEARDGAPVHTWLPEPPSPELRRLLRRIAHAADVRHVAVMPDAHVAEGIAVGCVVGTASLVYPEAVGGDLGCGMAALRFDGTAEALRDELAAARLLAGFERWIPPIRHRRPTAVAALPPELADPLLSAPGLEAKKRRDARVEFGTLGRGNHFVEILADDEERLWLFVHTGSRGIGRAIFEHHLQGTPPGADGFVAWPEDAPAGAAYLADLAWAFRYAEHSRALVVERAAAVIEEVLGTSRIETSRIVCQHNHVRAELHGGRRLLVHRKGAIPAAVDEAGIVPGSMGTASALILGRGEPASLCSSAHGAGRALSRGLARATISPRDLERQMSGVWFDHRRLDTLRDEAPAAYKDLDQVLRAQRPLVRLRHRLRPLLAYKGT